MRYRVLDGNSDYTFGQNSANFYVNEPAAVGQAVLTRLRLMAGEWFLDQTAGTPYKQILGKGTDATRDLAIQQVIIETQGVTGISSYASSLNPTTRKFSVVAIVDTIYGPTTVNYTF